MATAKPKTTKKPAKKAKLDDLDLDLSKLLAEIEEAEKHVQEAEIELDSRKEAAKSAKAEWMVAVSGLRQKVRTRERLSEEAKRQPLLQKPKVAQLPTIPEKLPEGAVSAKIIGILRDVPGPQGNLVAKKGESLVGLINEAGDCYLQLSPSSVFVFSKDDYAEIVSEKPKTEWRSVGIDKLNGPVTEKDREKLGLAGIYTMGDLQDRMQKAGTFWHQDVTGIGRAGADRVEDSFNKFVTANS